MLEDALGTTTNYQAWTAANLHRIPQFEALSAEQQLAIRTVAQVLPFRVNRYVVEELIDWSAVPDDPIFRLTFPQREMLDEADFLAVRSLLLSEAPREVLKETVSGIRARLNPHPAGQTTKNVPLHNGEKLTGVQHKYRETLLFFPSAGQTCHAYCTYCFRWAQFIGDRDLRFAAREIAPTAAYLTEHPEITDVLFTGGDPMIMKTAVLRRYIEPLLKVPSVRSIRIGTKSVAWWPQRFLTDADADDLMVFFEEIVASGRHLAIMGHYSHPRELSTPVAEAAVRRIRSTGAVMRCQAPLVRHVNDDADTWASMWRRQVSLGAIPYYMFMERDTGPRGYFEVPIVRALDIYRKAVSQVSGLARTVRGPSMSCTPGKVQVVDVIDTPQGKQIALRFLQGRDPAWAGRLFFAEYSDTAAWIDQLKPAGGGSFFFETPASVSG
ncbi:MAG: KamA family protein [Myxococcota bacterium]|jgi:KamA family protein